jgi:hypothetical protein
MRDALGATSQEIYATRHAIRILLRQIWQAQCFCIFMHACMLVSPARRRSGSTVRVEVLRLPPLTLFALEDNQSSASARTHRLLCASHLLGMLSNNQPRELAL